MADEQRASDDASSTIQLRNGLACGIARYGDPTGFPVYWCHGGLSSRLDAAPVHEAATAAGLSIVALDRPGIGQSSIDLPAGVWAWPEVVAEVADELGHPRFAVAGWSAGGPFAMSIARALPERVVATFLLASMYPVTDPGRRRELGLRIDRMLVVLSRRLPSLAHLILSMARRQKPTKVARTMIASAGTDDAEAMAAMDPFELAAPLNEAAVHGVDGVVEDYWAFGGDWGFSLNQVPGPALLWQGAEDTLVPLTQARRLAADLGYAELRIVPSCGHFLHYARAEDIVAVWRETIDAAR